MQNNDYHIKKWLFEQFSADYNLDYNIQSISAGSYVGDLKCSLGLI